MGRRGSRKTFGLGKGARATISKRGVRVSQTIGKRGGPQVTVGNSCLLQLLALLLLATAAWAADDPPQTAAEPDDAIARMQPVDYVRTVDGDTIVVELDGEETHVRLFAVDAPEIEEGTPEAFFAGWYLADLLSTADEVWIETDEEAQLLDPWDRTLAWVWFRPSGFPEGRVMLQSRLLNEGLCSYYPRVQSKRYPELADVHPGWLDEN